MKKKTKKKGLTIMEMLIVVAIIAVLAAILIPTFNGALTKSKEAADVANIRAGYAELQVKMLTDDTATVPTKEDFLKNYAHVDKLNYDKNFTYDTTKTPAEMAYDPDQINSGNKYTWTIQSPDIS